MRRVSWSHYFLGLVTGVLLSLAACSALADDGRRGELWGVATLASHHKERDRGYNEQNYGLGVEYHVDDRWHLAGGFYKNSFFRQTWYAAVGYELFSWKYLHVGAAAVALTGYTEGQVDVVVAPVASLEFGKFGINFAPITPYVTGFQVKWRFD